MIQQMKEEKKKIKLAQKEERIKQKRRLSMEYTEPSDLIPIKTEVEQSTPVDTKAEVEQSTPVETKTEVEPSPQSIIESFFPLKETPEKKPEPAENSQMSTLLSMGWTDKDRNQGLLNKYQGDLLRVIDELLRNC